MKIEITTLVLTLFGGAIGYYLRHLIEKRKDLNRQITQERREHYQEFVNLIIDVFGNSKTGKSEPDEKVLKKLYNFYKRYVLYASPEVINSFSDYFQYLYRVNSEEQKMDNKLHFKKLSKIMFEMRKNIGLSNKRLGTDGENLFRALIKDFDEVMK